MSEMNDERKIGVFGGVEFKDNIINNETVETTKAMQNVGTIRDNTLPVKVGFWQKFKAFWLQEIDWNKEIKVVLTPYQQKIEDEINEFLHQEITWEKVHKFLFKEINFRRKNNA